MEKKQTAVEWLVEQIRNDKFVKASDFVHWYRWCS